MPNHYEFRLSATPTTLRNVVAMCLALAVSWLLGDASRVHAADRPVVALITEQREKLPWIDVAEAALAGDARISLVDREHLDKVLREQKLELLMGPAGGATRIKVGQLVGCDVLIVLRYEAEPQDVVRVVIADTRTGIRLVTAEFSVKDLAETQQLPPELLTAALKKRAITNPLVLAIPPFANDDLSRGNQFLQGSLAAVCETVAARHPRILLVELDEAREIAKENTLTGGETSRVLPYYLLGRFRLESANEQQPPNATLRLERGDVLVVERTHPSPTSANIGAFVHGASAALLASIADKASDTEVDNAADAARLAKQSLEFMKIGEFEHGARLAEASLLLRPDQLDLRHSLRVTYKNLAELQYDDPRMDKQRFDRQFQKALSYAERGSRHFQIYLHAIEKPYSGNAHGVNIWSFDRHGHSDAKIHAAIVKHGRDYREMLIDVIETKTRRGETTGDMSNLLHPALGYYHQKDDGALKQYLIDRLRLLRIVEGVPRQRRYFYEKILTFGIASPDAEAFAFYESFFDAPDQELIAAAKKAKADGERNMGLRPIVSIPAKNLRPAAPSSKPPADVRSDIQVRLTPTEFGYLRNGQQTAIKFQGILSDGHDHDVAWGFHGERVVLHRQGSEPFLKIFETDNQHDFGHGCFDGKYVWLPVSGANLQLLRIDPAGGAIVKVDAEHGLPDVKFKLSSAVTAPLEPGRIVLVAAFGPHTAQRAFVAEIACNEHAPPRVRVVHEAREESLDLDGRADNENRKTNTKLAYSPKFVLPLRDQTSALPTRVLIARLVPGGGGVTNSLVVHLPTGRAVISPVAAHSHILRGDVVIHEGAAYWLANSKVWRVAAKDPSQRQAIADIEEDHGAIYIEKDGILIIGAQCWFSESWSKPFRRVHSDPERFRDSWTNSSHFSSHFGPLLKTSQIDWKIFRVELVRDVHPAN